MLDPEDDEGWEALRQLGHRMIDDLIAHTKDLRKERVWSPPSHKARQTLQGPLPQEGLGLERAYQDYLELVRSAPTGNAHPRFYGWMMGGGALVGALAELLAAGANTNAFGGLQGATLVEHQVLEHFRALFGLPSGSSGLMLSGASMANLLALAIARKKTGGSRIYASAQTHVSILKAASLMGLPKEDVCLVDCDDQGRVDLAALERALDEDRAQGHLPLALVGNAGTINTGAVDDLAALSELAQTRGLWLHIDGAVGAVAMLCERLRPQFSGIERADSIAFDMHKWLQLPYEAGCLLVRDARAHRRAFTEGSSYLARLPGGLGGSRDWFNQLGPELSRGFKALKVWMALRAHGTRAFAKLIDQSEALTRALAQRIDAHPRLERLAGPGLCILCFRYVAPEMIEADLDRLNTQLAVALQEKGLAVLSLTRVDKKIALRVALSNHRTRAEDVEALVEACAHHGARLSKPR